MKGIKSYISLFIFVVSFFSVECFIKPLFIPIKSTHKSNRFMSKHNFLDFTQCITTNDKYFLIQSLINDVVLNRKELMYEYCYKNLNYTDVMHIRLSDELADIIKLHYKTNTILQLYDIIRTNSYSKDCHIHVYRLNDTLSNIPLK